MFSYRTIYDFDNPDFVFFLTEKTTYALLIYTAPCVMFLMQADTLRGEVGFGLEIESFLGL
jgi:hypothetical protein